MIRAGRGDPDFDETAKLITEYLRAAPDYNRARKVVYTLLGERPLAVLTPREHAGFRPVLKAMLDELTTPTQPCEVLAEPMTVDEIRARCLEAVALHTGFKREQRPGSAIPEDPWARTFHR